MAAARSTGSLQDMVECCICVDEFTDPRMLPCIHTFCLACLEKIGKDKQPGEAMPCPLCRSAFKIPVSGFQGIQKNFFVQNLLDVHRLSTVDSTKAFCEACSEDDSVEETSIASVICIECCQKLCDLCCQYHKRHKLSKQHQLVDLKNVETISRLSKKSAQSFCDRHNNEQIKMYCFDCKSSNCLVCQIESHQGHKCSDIEKASQHFSLQLEEVNKKILCCFNSSKGILTKLDVNSCWLSEKIASLQLDVKKQADMLKKLVDEHANQLFSEIDSIKASKLKQIENEKEEVSMLSTMLVSLRRYSSEMQEKGSAVDICQNFLKIKARSDELEKSHTALRNSTLNPKDDCFHFSQPDLERFLKNTENVVGKIGMNFQLFYSFFVTTFLFSLEINSLEKNKSSMSRLSSKEIPITNIIYEIQGLWICIYVISVMIHMGPAMFKDTNSAVSLAGM